jgi:hypothetical protein
MSNLITKNKVRHCEHQRTLAGVARPTSWFFLECTFMLRRDLLRTGMATPLAGWLRPWMQAAFGGTAIKGPNAALIYRKVFGWSKGLPPDELELLRKAATIKLDDPRIENLIQKAAPVLEAIQEAAMISQCRWETEIISPDDLGKGRLDFSNVDAIRVACLSARRHVRLGRGRDALDDVFAGLTLAHRVGTGGALIARIMECGGEIPAFQTLGRVLPELDRATLDDLSRRLDVLPPPEPASATVGPESRFIICSLRAKLGATGPVIDDAEWGDLGFDDKEAAALKRLTGGDRARLLAHLEATGPAFAELARRLDLPRPGCRAALDEFADAERSLHPVAASLVESAWGVRHVVDRMRALRAMLHAGLVLVRDGEPAFRAESDPFGAGPFGLERRGKGYLIRSALNDGGKPEVSLEIGDLA